MCKQNIHGDCSCHGHETWQQGRASANSFSAYDGIEPRSIRQARASQHRSTLRSRSLFLCPSKSIFPFRGSGLVVTPPVMNSFVFVSCLRSACLHLICSCSSGAWAKKESAMWAQLSLQRQQMTHNTVKSNALSSKRLVIKEGMFVQTRRPTLLWYIGIIVSSKEMVSYQHALLLRTGFDNTKFQMACSGLLQSLPTQLHASGLALKKKKKEKKRKNIKQPMNHILSQQPLVKFKFTSVRSMSFVNCRKESW